MSVCFFLAKKDDKCDKPVTVYVWGSKNQYGVVKFWQAEIARNKGECEAQVGHVAIETFSGGYMSYWPFLEQKISAPHKRLDPLACGFVNSLAEDIAKEGGRKPDHTLQLHNLDVAAIDKAFKDFRLARERSLGWSLLGRDRRGWFNQHLGQSGSILAWALLKVGGIDAKLRKWSDWELKWCYSTPNAIYHMALAATLHDKTVKAMSPLVDQKPSVEQLPAQAMPLPRQRFFSFINGVFVKALFDGNNPPYQTERPSCIPQSWW